MARVRYVDRRFYEAKTRLLPAVLAVIEEYAAAGFTLNSRGVAYRLEGRGIIPKDPEVFQRVEDIVAEGREMGQVDWDLVAGDAGRGLRASQTWNGAKARLLAAAETYRLDKWAAQPRRVELWTEKEGLLGIIGEVCDEFDVPIRATTGYDGKGPEREGALRIMSRTPLGRATALMHEEFGDGGIQASQLVGSDSPIGEALRTYLADDDGADQQSVILWVGDHDPSGMDLERDVLAKLHLYGAREFTVKRVAVTCAETCELIRSGLDSALHSNPAKESDKRWPKYVAAGHTARAWEVEAIEPAVLAERVREAIVAHVDVDVWNATVEAQEADRRRIIELAEGLR